MATVFLGTVPGTEAYWDVLAQILSSLPNLSAQGISAYTIMAPSFIDPSMNFTSLVDGYLGIFLLPGLHPSNTSDSLAATINTLFADVTAPYPMQFFTSVTSNTYADFWAYYEPHNGPSDAGHDQVLGSRLLDKKALTGNLTALKQAFKAATPPGSVINAYLVGGKGVMDATPRGGSNAVNPAWRKAFVHAGKFSTSCLNMKVTYRQKS